MYILSLQYIYVKIFKLPNRDLINCDIYEKWLFTIIGIVIIIKMIVYFLLNTASSVFLFAVYFS